MKNLIPILFITIFLGFISTACKQQNTETKTHEAHQQPKGYYTCSMHPQVHSEKPGQCPICGMELIFVNGQQKQGFTLSQDEMLLANITLETAKLQPFDNDLILTARLTDDPVKTNEITAWIKGRIDVLSFQETGKHIHKGDLLYTIYSEELVKIQNDYLLALRERQMAKGLNLDYDRIVSGARNKLFRFGLTQNQIDRLEARGKAWESLPVFSKWNGIITEIPVKQGDYVVEGSPVFKLSNFSTLWVEAQVYATETSWLHRVHSAEVRIEGFPQTLTGVVSFINPELEKNSKINLIRIEIPNPEGKFMPGMQAYVTIKTAIRNSIVISRDAVLRDAMGPSLWVRDSLGNFTSRMVTLGPEKHFQLEILSGLEPGEEYVATGAYLLNSEYILKKGSGMGMEGMPGMNHKH